MSTSSTPSVGPSTLIHSQTTKSASDWVATSLLTAKTIAAAAECEPFPYVKSVLAAVVVLLEAVEKVQKNREDLKELCDDTLEIIAIVRDQISAHGDIAAVKFKGLCENLELCLQDVLETVKPLQQKSRGFGHVKEVFKLSSTTKQITDHQNRIQTLRLNFVLMATMDTNFQIHKLTAAPIVPVSQVTPSTNTCPPPSRIFHGRQVILTRMHKYFTQDTGKQHIFLLYGLGGAGKTQISLKYIEESGSLFSDIWLIDASTQHTIMTGLKNIAVAQDFGETPQDALQWLRSKPAPWLLLFDNVDDPKLNLNNFLPLCNHGNIIMTSRNPELCVYADSYSPVSDMEKADAVALLLTTAKEESKPTNQEIAAEIVEVLCYLPLAIIQAGAFIAKSGALRSYLELYKQNRERLLREKPAQSHDDYAWTVYTTWQISFEKLSPPAATLLQLCSFVHHKGISEKIFSNASTYECKTSGPSQEELEKPQAFISQFLRPDGSWDSLCFLDVTTELRAFSLINLHMETGLFSIHPLVHIWSQSTMTDPKVYHFSMTAIMGMSIASISQEERKLASLWLLPHIDLLLQGATDITPDFNSYFALVYQYCGKLPKAQDLGVVALETHKRILGDNHPDTLMAMANLAVTYRFLGQLKNAAELEDLVLKTRKSLLGDNHPDTLTAMANLAATYRELGQLKRAAELQVVVLEKTKTVLGEDHPDTLLAMGSLAFTYHGLGQLREAEELEILVLKKQKATLGEDHPETVRAMANLAVTYNTLGQLNKAEELKVAVLNKRKTILGEDHLATLWAMGNLAVTYRNQGELKKAVELEVVVLEKRKTFLGEDHPHTLSAMGNLAWTYHKQGELKMAEELQVLVFKKRKATLGEGHPDTLSMMGNLASTYEKLGKLEEAESLRVLVEEIRKKT
ncbi:hypothetical protein B0H13DRAFT_2017973 [Mycena leptocephala]|nr:hypothetical protein B0H13DRAFT_2017973 [Mycena leptocephala]